ncbi:hypothetical protein NB714_001280 [Pantoea dispersa]|nr:hypothetical protein [Pantoea dispersa]MCW0325155.1 hypothetical protein [Pantoea dispersa]MCW0431117.1 hypothetical protein [Pantoea dispersa]
MNTRNWRTANYPFSRNGRPPSLPFFFAVFCTFFRNHGANVRKALSMVNGGKIAGFLLEFAR